MRRIGLWAAAAAIMVMTAAAPAAAAAGVEGVWARTDGKAKVRFAPCGAAVCGTVVWLRDTNGPGRIGEQVFFGMQPGAPGHWAGSAHNPEDGRDYDGTLVLAGNRLTTQGCALGGMICKTFSWTRSR